jgi:hypothetical protein
MKIISNIEGFIIPTVYVIDPSLNKNLWKLAI